MQIYAVADPQFLKPIPNPRGTQTVPQSKPTLPRTPGGRFAPEFRPHPETALNLTNSGVRGG